MFELRLPRLVGTREAARHLIEDSQVPLQLDGEAVVIHCRDLSSGSPSYADELVEVLLGQRQARELAVVGAPPKFESYIRQAAKTRNFPASVITVLETA